MGRGGTGGEGINYNVDRNYNGTGGGDISQKL
jgi:hypothetical protein